MSSSILSQLALDDVVDGSSPDLTSIPHSRASRKPRANHTVCGSVWFLSMVPRLVSPRCAGSWPW
jgi:hypothetical protein